MASLLLYSSNKNAKDYLFLFACMLSAVPIWLSTYLPMLDLPFHAYQISSFLRLVLGTEFFASILKINWFMPYWLGYLSAAILALFMPIAIAIKIVLSCAMVATPWFASRLRALVSNDNSLDWLFLPVIYSFAFQNGLFNFIVSIPLVLFFLREAILYFSDPGAKFKSGVWIVFLSHILFFTHILALLFSLVIVIPMGLCLCEDTQRLLKERSFHYLDKKVFFKFLPFICILPIILVWMLHIKDTSFHTNIPAGKISVWIINLYRLLPIMVSATGLLGFFQLGLIYVLAIFLLPGAKIHKNWRALPFVILILGLLLLPATNLETNYIAERLNVFILIFYVFSFDFSQLYTKVNYYKRVILFASSSFLILFLNAYQLHLYAKETKGLKNIFSKMAPHHSVASIIDNTDKNQSSAKFDLLIYWYHAEKDGKGTFSLDFPQMIVQYKSDIPYSSTEDQFHFSNFKWDNNTQKFDYYVIKTSHEKFPAELLLGLQKYTKLIYHEDSWYLYAKHNIDK
ncbi:MAG: hypothetical protein V4525_09905 [Pseudomonadota bacterium]